MLTINNLSAGYGKVQVLHGVSIEVPKGKVVTLIGSNGAGKTTTMRAVSGMIAPTAGEITLNGKRIDGLESFHIAKLGLAHSPEGRRVFATMTVTDNLTLGAFPRLTGSRPRGDDSRRSHRGLAHRHSSRATSTSFSTCGRSVMIPSTPRSSSRVISVGSSIVHTCTW